MNEESKEKLKLLQKIYDESSNIVFFGGAGVSTESGIPDFRSIDGLYYQQWKYPPETILSHSFFEDNAQEFYRFYRKKMIYLEAKPNSTHKILSQMEAKGKLKAIVTQNIDGLHQKAGSKNVFELHGSILRNYCTKCHKFYSEKKIIESTNEQNGLPLCDCGGLIKPDVVLYEEGLDDFVVESAIKAISKADVLIIGGTSLVVYPAASFIDYYHGKKLVLINKSETMADSRANLVFHESLGEVLSSLQI